MEIAKKKIGFALTGSFCTLTATLVQMQRLVDMGVDLTPIFSYNVNELSTRFISAAELRNRVTQICGKRPITSIVEAEPIGPNALLDAVVIAPCTGNTMAKLANGITDTPVLMAAKANLRNQRPVIIAVSTNDGLGANAKNIGTLMHTQNIYFVPFGQDGPMIKENSLLARLDLIPQTMHLALQGTQIQPVLLGTGELMRE